jgi:putative nucleotidyltransferase with HDIG domain
MPAARPPTREAAPKPGAASNPRPPGIAGMDVEELMVISKGEVVLRLLETFRSPNYRPPRLPAAAMQLLELTRKPDVAVTQVVALLQNEQLLAAEVLKLAQSVRYSGSSPVRTLDEAIVRLGLSRTGDLFLEAALNMRVFRAPGYNEQMDRLRKHSSAVAQLARLVSRHTAVYDEHAYLCGLLHDIGIAAALIAFAELGPRGGAPPFELVWPGIFEAHEECAGVLARMWQLPSEIALVVSHHHDFYVGGRPHPTAAAVCLAGAIAEDVGFGFGEPTGAQAEDAARVLQLDGATLERIRRSARDLVSTLE